MSFYFLMLSFCGILQFFCIQLIFNDILFEFNVIDNLYSTLIHECKIFQNCLAGNTFQTQNFFKIFPIISCGKKTIFAETNILIENRI